MTKRRVEKKRGNVNRLLLRRWSSSEVEDRLWDRDGRFWTLAREELSREEAERLYRDPTVPVAIYESATTLRWVDPEEGRAAWPELEARAFSKGWCRPPPSAPGARPFIAQEWRSDHDRLFLFDDYDCRALDRSQELRTGERAVIL